MLSQNFIELFQNSFRDNWELPALTDYFKKESFTYGELAKEVEKLHLLFKVNNIKPGDKIAVIGRNNPRWCVSFMAAITYGAVVVPILQEFNPNDVNYIIHHSGAKVLFAGDRFWDYINTDNTKLIAVFSLTDLQCVWAIERSKRCKWERSNAERLLNEKYPNGFAVGDVKYSYVDNSKMTVINYTSGTTGYSKGVMLSANNLCGNMLFGHNIKVHFKGSRALSFLPLAHAFGCAFDFLYPLTVGAHITLLGKIPSPKVLLDALKDVKPHMIFLVPLIIEKIYKKQLLPMLNKKITKLSMKLPIIETTVNSIVRRKLMEAFGGEMYEVIIGGAPLNQEVEQFLTKIKFPFTIGYGMTECAPLISYTDHKEFKPTSCGKVISEFLEVRIDSSDPSTIAGEIQVRGEHVMMGYYRNEKATAEVFTEDGWLKTGDIGTADSDGTIYIRGRSKTMLLRASGQNIYPEEIESKLNNLPYILESLVLQREGKLIALVYPDNDQIDVDSVNNEDEFLKNSMANNLILINSLVAPYERLSEIRIFYEEFEKTPKKSIKRYLYNV